MNKKSNEIIHFALRPIWQVNKGIGSFITFDIGEKKKNNGLKYLTGPIHLWIYLCDWVIVKNDKVLSQSEDTAQKINSVLQIFINQTIISISEADQNEVVIQFSNELKLILKGNDDFYEIEDDFFILYTPIGNVAYNKKSKFC